MTPALAKLVEGEAPRQEPPAAVQPPTPAPSILPSWYWLALDIILLVTAELLVAFGRGIPGWIKWPVVFACVIAGAACALWAVLQHHFPRRTPKDAALGRVVFR